MLWQAAVTGIFATLLMDAVAVIGTRLGFLRKGHLGLLARWMRQLARGHRVAPDGDIRRAEARPGDVTVGFLLHYGIGIVLALVYFGALSASGARPGTTSALVYGFATNVFPWFLMYPSMGFGFFGASAPPEARLLPTSLVAHLSYGIGLGLGAMVIF